MQTVKVCIHVTGISAVTDGGSRDRLTYRAVPLQDRLRRRNYANVEVPNTLGRITKHFLLALIQVLAVKDGSSCQRHHSCSNKRPLSTTGTGSRHQGARITRKKDAALVSKTPENIFPQLRRK
ncbi:hypothetical protein NDU88_006189 [Pleurodeles waltl]|uniref:Uncharacterized protein n=1 Tax=Pleurodeles waltl TaxID=8319 RepID=A0AAV7SNU0_PLEWA|nr:hypothetical protein NDU88_006189 [Pleurodeles waltl]